MKLEEIPPIPGYISVARTAKILGMTKASVYYKIYEQNAFKTVFKLPGSEDESRPVLLLLESEVRRVGVREAEERTMVPLKERLAGWNTRVKTWGSDNGWQTPIHRAGQPPKALQEAYLSAHPEDVRPE